ncbi:MAG: glycosyltransferase [Tepidisphaerales bacterium]
MKLGVVTIGRNEGERLRACLASLREQLPPGTVVVYVDSGSTDGSVEVARSFGAEVVELDLSVPFTAARARNAGARRLREVSPSCEFILFLDGDCRLCEGFVEAAVEAMSADGRLAVVCGRRRELRPRRNVYHRLAEIEWNTPVGPATACGGDALMRRAAFEEVGGFEDGLIAGEEPELCVRLRERGWGVLRIDRDMTLHDVDMTRFGQWWARSVRAGYAFAAGSARHGGGATGHWRRQARRVWVWAVGVPLVALGLAWPTGGWSLALLLVYVWPLRGAYVDARRRGHPRTDSAWYAAACLLGKWAELRGQLRYLTERWSGRRGGIIEYKGGAVTPPGVSL